MLANDNYNYDTTQTHAFSKWDAWIILVLHRPTIGIRNNICNKQEVLSSGTKMITLIYKKNVEQNLYHENETRRICWIRIASFVSFQPYAVFLPLQAPLQWRQLHASAHAALHQMDWYELMKEIWKVSAWFLSIKLKRNNSTSFKVVFFRLFLTLALKIYHNNSNLRHLPIVFK